MANNYSVEDILDEVRRKKRISDADLIRAQRTTASTLPPFEEEVVPQARPTRHAKSSKPAAPFQLSGMTDEFELPMQAVEPPRSTEREYTRLDIPIRKTGVVKQPDEAGATRIMPPVRPARDSQLEERRQQRVQEFMQHPFSLDEEDGDLLTPSDSGQIPVSHPSDDGVDEDDVTLASLSQFFDGLSRSTVSTDRRGHKRGEREDPFSPKKSAPSKKETARRDSRRQQPDRTEKPMEGEYTAARDRLSVSDDIRSIRRGLAIRILVTGFCTILLLYFSLCNLYPLPLWHPLCPENDPRMFLLLNLVVLAAAALASNTVIGGGLISLFTLKADNDTPAALATLACVAHGVALWVNSDPDPANISQNFLKTGDSFFYFAVAAAALLMNAVGKYMMISRIDKNFSVISTDAPRCVETLLADDLLAEELCEGQGLEEPAVCCPVQVEFSKDFLRHSYSADYSENFSRLSAPLFLLFALIVALGAKWIAGESALAALTGFCAVLCLAAPFTATIAGNLPLLRAANRLTKEGACITGYDAVELFDDANAVALDAADLYPPGNVTLHGIKAFAQSRIDEAILDAASVMCSVDGLLKDIFLGVIGRKTAILKKVDSLSYEDDRGLCASVDGKPVLIGNRELMRAHGISTPSKDYESKFIKGDRQILYLANSGEVTAMFVLSYQISEDTADWIDILNRQEMSLIVRSTDPNITAARIAADYDYPEEYIRVIPAALLPRYLQRTAPAPDGQAHIVSLSGAAVRLRAIAAVRSIRNSIAAATIFQLVGLVINYAIVAFLAFTGGITQIGFLPMLALQIFWTFAVMLTASLGRI